MSIKPPKPINLRAKAFELLARRDYSYAELGAKLSQYSPDHDTISEILNQLQDQGYLNDERYIENYIRSKGHHYGSLKLKYLLKQKVNDPQLVAQLYEQAEIDELTIACQLLRRKHSQPPTSPALQAKYLRFLIGRGFTSQIAYQALRQAYQEEDK